MSHKSHSGSEVAGVLKTILIGLLKILVTLCAWCFQLSGILLSKTGELLLKIVDK